MSGNNKKNSWLFWLICLSALAIGFIFTFVDKFLIPSIQNPPVATVDPAVRAQMVASLVEQLESDPDIADFTEYMNGIKSDSYVTLYFLDRDNRIYHFGTCEEAFKHHLQTQEGARVNSSRKELDRLGYTRCELCIPQPNE